MRILIKLAVTFALLAAIVYGSIYGYIWNAIKKEVETRVAQAKPVVEISYKELTLSPMLDGTITATGLTLKPVNTSDQVAIQSFKVSYPGVVDLLKAAYGQDKPSIPDQLHVHFSGMSANLNGPLITALDKAMKQAQAQAAPPNEPKLAKLANFDALGCGAISVIGFDEMTHMGYQKLELDGDLDYRYARRYDNLTFSLMLRSKGMYSLDIKGEIKSDLAGILMDKTAHPLVGELRIDYVDSGYTLLRNRFCASQINSTEEEFKIRHIEALSQAVDAAFPLESVEHYTNFLAGDGRFTLTFAPKAQSDLWAIGGYSLQEAVEPLGIGLAIDNKEVNLKSLGWGKRFNVELAREQRAAKLAEQNRGKEPNEAGKMPQFRTTSLTLLHNYVGNHVQVTMRGGQLREGVIDGVEAETVTIRVYHKKGRGYISYAIPLDDISSARVFY